MARQRRGQRAAEQEKPLPLFLGSTYSNQECEFLIEHLGKPSELALQDEDSLPDGMNPAAVKPILDLTYRLQLVEDAAKESGVEGLKTWCGFDALKEVLEGTLRWRVTTQELKKRTRGATEEVRRAAGAPSLCLWDPDTDIPYMGGVGADTEIVRTMLDGNKRIALFAELKSTGVGALRSLTSVAGFLRGEADSGKRTEQMEDNSLTYTRNGSFGAVACPICHFSDTYTLASPSAKRESEGKVIAHLKSARIKKEAHRILLKRIESGHAGRGREPQTTEE